MPDSIAKVLWGDRKKWGLIVQEDDPCWREGGGYTSLSTVKIRGKESVFE
jgi:hypothetical protein